MKNFILGTSVFILAACASQGKSPAPAASTGYQKAETCIACHGADGISGKKDVPPIGHMSADAMSAALTKLKEANPDSPLIAHTLTKEDVRDIAGYFSSVNK
jgi:cytochrome c553